MDVLIYLILFFMGTDRSKPPSPEVPKLIKQLGDDEWKVREGAQRKLEKMGPEIHTALEETIKKDKDLERRKRCERILPKVLNVCSDDKDNWCPSIYYLPNPIRFPKGFDYDLEDYNPDHSGLKFTAEIDVAKMYIEKARDIHNKKYPRSPIRDDCWREEWLEKDAMQLFMRDLRIKGVPFKTCKKILNWSVDFEKNYTLPYSGEKLPPPPLMNGLYYGYGYGSCGYGGCNKAIPDGNWKEPHTIAKWLLRIKEWPTPQSIYESLLEKLRPAPQYQGHPVPTP